MKTLRLIAVSFVFAAIFAISAVAQTTTTAATGKVYVINTGFFADQKEGITKFSNALKQLDTEMGPRYKELETMATQAQALAKEITTLREQLAANPKAPIKPEDVQAKADKFQQMQIDYKRKEEDTKQAVGKRSQALLDPIRFDIYKVMQEFAKQKNYPIILDVAKLDEQNLILAIGDDKVDLTKEFIAFYNARPATAATTATK